MPKWGTRSWLAGSSRISTLWWTAISTTTTRWSRYDMICWRRKISKIWKNMKYLTTMKTFWTWHRKRQSRPRCPSALDNIIDLSIWQRIWNHCNQTRSRSCHFCTRGKSIWVEWTSHQTTSTPQSGLRDMTTAAQRRTRKQHTSLQWTFQSTNSTSILREVSLGKEWTTRRTTMVYQPPSQIVARYSFSGSQKVWKYMCSSWSGIRLFGSKQSTWRKPFRSI